jgi:heat shock protein HtpX
MLAWGKRIGLFLIVNILVMITLSVFLKVFGIQPYLDRQGINYGALLAFCLIWGMGGAFISLALSKTTAKWAMGVQIIEANTRDPQLRDLLDSVRALSQKAQLPMPEVGIYQSPEINAFATGATRSGALVAVSSGLLQRMEPDERDGVLGHELAHIANGDMVTMTLLQGVVNAFVMFLARIIASVIARSGDQREGQSFSFLGYYATVFVLEIVFMLFGSMVVAAFSRWREFRADAGGAALAGKGKMIAALEGLQSHAKLQDPRAEQQEQFQALKISSRSRFLFLFASHPPLERRIAALRAAQHPSL